MTVNVITFKKQISMEGGQSVVTLSLLASLAIFGALFGPTKFGDGDVVTSHTVTGPVIVQSNYN